MEGKMKDLLKSGLVLVAVEQLDRFVSYLVARGVFPRIGNRFNGGVIVIVEG